MMTTDMITLPVENMSCDHCAERVTGALEGVDGVAEAEVDLGSGQATVIANENVSRERLGAAVEEAGYRVPAET